jgi:hypothetical protein
MEEILAEPGAMERVLANYDPPRGNPKFITALAALFRREFGWQLGPENVAITAGGQLMRIEGLDQPGGAGGYLIIDRRSQRMVMVVPKEKHYLELPASDVFSRGFLLNAAMGFTRRGNETVAGLPCTVWEISARSGGGTACITDDGVLLRGRGQRGAQAIEATRVAYGPQPATLFKPPADFTRLDVPPPPQRGAPPPPQR